MSRIRVSVGIPVYGYEPNIKALLNSILTQRINNDMELHEIIIVADECAIETLRTLYEFAGKDSRIRIYRYDKRRGKAAAVNEIFGRMTGDFLALLDADVIPSNDEVLSNLINPLVSDSKIGLVGGLPIPLPPSTLIERASVFSHKIQRYIKEHVNNGRNIYAAHGQILALSSSFAKNVKIPDIPGVDAFLYLSCINSGYRFLYVGEHASVYYRAPNNKEDYLRQSVRFKKAQIVMRELFGALADKEFKSHKVTSILLYAYAKNFFKDPLGAFLWTILFLYSTVKSKKSEVSAKWRIAVSTKFLRLT